MKPDLMDVHSKLSELSFAVHQAIGGIPTVIVEWHPITYLQVRVECFASVVQRVSDVLSHGVLQGEYDYRFTSVCTPNVEDADPWDWVTVIATPDMVHDMRKRIKDATA